jgi:hypothetical protein
MLNKINKITSLKWKVIANSVTLIKEINEKICRYHQKPIYWVSVK